MSATAKLQRAVAALERRWMSCRGPRRHATVPMARKALREAAEVIALIGLHLPKPHDVRLLDPVLDALERSLGRRARAQ
jgi:hypothetical protein